ncbi:hypothetical protein B1C78_11135 [Thioalkalivibrio denitrificans]|uniref:Uncharacterized protein n=1 Tax=Thioalkalivibrio denitrificans TaxID=108003 RepID=A0A1V3NEI6_9GAMM|nr:contractile injection system protein, VgrG/Pvc8 family [Thioalkalivibrio denitrificans]OOG23480.1 hypothetical protein B1C78_11135 [Thioalkalivibrio denitrificans]
MSTDVPFQRVRAHLEIAGEPLRVERIHGREGISRLASLDVDVVGDGFAVSALMGAPARLSLAGEQGGAWQFAGLLTACGPNPDAAADWCGEHPFRVTLSSALHRLTLGEDDRLFVGISDVNLAHLLGAASGLAVQAGGLRARYPVRTGILQCNENHYAVLTRALARAGIWFYCAPVDGVETLVLHDDAGAVAAALDALLPWQGVDAGWARRSPGVFGFAERTEAVHRRIHVHGRLADGRPYRAEADTGLGEGTASSIAYGLHTPEALAERARVLCERARTRHLTLSLETTALIPGPGRWLEIGELPGARADLPRPWLIEAVEHEARAADDGWLAYRNRLTLKPRAQAYRPEAPERERPLPEFIAARIEGAGPSLDGEGHQQARALFEAIAPVGGSARPWLSRLTPYAAPPGEDDARPSGWVTPFHEGQEVRLICLGNDPDGFAVLSAGAFNAAQQNPVTADNPSEHRYQTVCGHTLVMDDLKGEEVIRLHTAGEQHLLSLNAHYDAHTLSMICRQGPAAAYAHGRFSITTGADVNERIGDSRTHLIEQAAHTETRQGPIHHQAATTLSALAHAGVEVLAGQDLQFKAGTDTELVSGRDMRLSVRRGDFTATVSGDLRIQADGDLIIESLDGSPIFVGTPEGGITIDTANEEVTIHGRDIDIEGERVEILGQVNYSTGAPGAPDTPKIDDVPVLQPTAPLVPAGEPAVIHPAWVQARVALGEEAHLAFTVRDAEAGKAVEVEILDANGDPVDRIEHRLTQGHGRETLAWAPDAAHQAKIRPLEADPHDDELRGPEGLHFRVLMDGLPSETSGPLLLTADLEIEHRDTQDRPLDEGIEVRLADAEGTIHSAYTDAQGRSLYRRVPVGVVDWVFGSASAAETVRVDDTLIDPCRHVGCQVIDGAPLIHTKSHHLPPPVMINIRDDAPDDAPRLLSERELDYFREQGNNALVFIHGYNVALGEPGRHFEGVRKVSARMSAFHARWERADWAARPATVHQDVEALRRRYPRHAEKLTDHALNGTAAHNWRVHLEYQLNRAAGFDGRDYEPYTRILAVAWSGDVLAHDFHRSELNAQRAGRRLVPLLWQLHEAGLKINVITHSLGARVLLTALNVLGEQHTDLLDHAFLWQPAVADNALSNSPASDPNPFKVGVFPYAHRAARQFVVLHSVNDPILGGRPRLALIARHLGVSTAELNARVATMTRNSVSQAINAWAAALLRPDEHEATLWEAAIGTLGGAYPKKWWPVPTAGLGGPLAGLYDDYAPLAFSTPGSGGASRWVHPESWKRLELALMQEMHEHEHLDMAMDDPDSVPEYRLLNPIATRGVIREHHVKCYLEHLRALIENGFTTGTAPRPALGHVGFEEIRKVDQFVRDQLEAERFAFVKQDQWLFTHSGMRIPDDRLFEEVYVNQIWRRFLRTSGFGHYS